MLKGIPRREAADLIASRAGNRMVAHTHGGSLVRIHALRNELTVRGRWIHLWSFVEDPNDQVFVEWAATELARLDRTVSPGAWADFHPNGNLSVGFTNIVNGRVAPSVLSVELRLHARQPFRVRVEFERHGGKHSFGSAPAAGLHYASQEYFLRTSLDRVGVNWQVQEPEGAGGRTPVHVSLSLWRWNPGA